MNTYTWTISSVECKASEDGLTNVIKVVHWRYRGTDEDGITAEIYGAQPFLPPTATDFIPFEEITTSQVIEWLEDTLSVIPLEGISTQLEEYRTSITSQIELIKNPVMVTLQLQN